MDKVVISPPYGKENIHHKDGKEGKDEQALSYIKGIVSTTKFSLLVLKLRTFMY
jgi:hypothetical protein